MNNPAKTYHPRIWRPQGAGSEKSRIRGKIEGQIEGQIEERLVACEIPIALEYNCVSHAVMMISPMDVEDFAVGFSLTEGIIDHPDHIMEVAIAPKDKGLVAALEITPASFDRLDRFKRTLVGRTGCGLCGIDRLDHAIRPLHPIKSQLTVKAEVVYNSMQQLANGQVHNKKTGALHAAAFVTAAGEIRCIREDIGRHNALDKLIGHMMRQKINPANGFALITSRCSFEMVHKCATFGIPVLAAISATTDLALTLAEDADLSLIAFVRKDGMNIYCDPKGRIL